MKKLMVLAAVAAMALGAKADWVCDCGDFQIRRSELPLTVEIGHDESGDYLDITPYTQVYLMSASDWDGTLASLSKSMAQTTLQKKGGYDELYASAYVYPEGDKTLSFSGSVDESSGYAYFVSTDNIRAVFTDVDKSSYLVYVVNPDQAWVAGFIEGDDTSDLHIEAYVDAYFASHDLKDPNGNPMPVPEPTSGLLLLLGVAGLALKRKRA